MKQLFLLLVTVLCLSMANGQNNVGINTSTPLAGLHVAETDVVFTNAGKPSNTPGDPPVSGQGRRMMWYPDRAAFRAGYAENVQWDAANIGKYSFATGNSAQAQGETSFAAGYYTVASGFGAVAVGYSAFATGGFSMAGGSNTSAIGANSLALGDLSTALGIGSFAFGNQCRSVGNFSMAMGTYARAEGSNSFALGISVLAKPQNAFVIGAYNDTTAGEPSNNNTPADRVFQVGIGSGDMNRKNALTVLRNGNTGIGTPTPASLLEVNGKMQTDQLQVGTGTTITGIQAGTHIAGASASGLLTTTITFPTAFASAPKLIATIRHDPAWNVNDSFLINVKSVSNTQAVLLIRRVDVNAAWNQNLLVDYMAIQ